MNQPAIISQSVRGHVLAFITQAIWSSTFVVSKLLLSELSPIQVLVSRFILATAFLSLLAPPRRRRLSLREELPYLASGTALALYFLFENSALQRTWSSNVSLVIATIPLLTGVLSMIALRTRLLQPRGLAGLVIAYGGVLLVMAGSQRFAGVSPAGDLMAFGAALMFAVYSLVLQRLPGDQSPLQTTRRVFGYVLLVLLAAAVPGGQPLLPRSLSVPAVLSLLFLGLVASSCAFIFWNTAIRAIGPVRTSQYIYLAPVMTTLLSSMVLHEQITLFTVLGTALILTGLVWTDRSQPLPQQAEPPRPLPPQPEPPLPG